MLYLTPNTTPAPSYLPGVLNEGELIVAYISGCHYVDTSFLSRYASLGLALINPQPTSDEPLLTTTATVTEGDFGPSLASAVPEPHHGKQDKGDNKRGVKLVFTPEQLVNREKCTRVMDLTDGQYSRQFIGIESGCVCFMCTRHTRAYVNHLFNTKEMLGPTLVSLHNFLTVLVDFKKGLSLYPLITFFFFVRYKSKVLLLEQVRQIFQGILKGVNQTVYSSPKLVIDECP